MNPIGSLRRQLLPAQQLCERKLHRLSFLFFELSQACNLQCLHCGSDCRREDLGPSLAPEEVLGVLTEIKRAYDPHGVSVCLSGGEPLCYPGVFDLGRAIHALEFPWGMVTNGFAWTAKEVAHARRAGMQSVTVSLDGLEENHDWFRGRKGSFRRAANTLRMLLAEPFLQALDVVTCVHRRNLRSLPEVQLFLEGLGVRQWRLFTVSPIGRAAQSPDLLLDRAEFLDLLSQIARIRRTSGMQVSYSESGYWGEEFDCAVRDQPYFCRAGVNVAGVMADGEILACPNIDRSFGQGNIRQKSFVDVWEHGYQAFRDRRWMKAGECGSCSEWRFCQGNSFHLWDPEQSRTRLCYRRHLSPD